MASDNSPIWPKLHETGFVLHEIASPGELAAAEFAGSAGKSGHISMALRL